MMRNLTRAVCLKISAVPAIFFLCALPITHAVERITYYHTDALGSPTAATDQQGNVVWRETYEPYGERIKKVPASRTNARWHTGHVLDAETGLQYAGARYYDPVIGRFMGADPKGFAQANPHSFNRYNYGNNNPYKYIDPDGRAAETVLDVISLGLSINEYRQNPSFWNGVGVAVDAFGTAVPFIPAGVGTIRQIGKGADKLSDGVKTNIEQVNPRNLIPTQTRQEMSGSEVKRLTKDMEKNGFNQSKPIDAMKRPDGRLEIQDGHHRTEAAIKAGLEKVPVRISE